MMNMEDCDHIQTLIKMVIGTLDWVINWVLCGITNGMLVNAKQLVDIVFLQELVLKCYLRTG